MKKTKTFTINHNFYLLIGYVITFLNFGEMYSQSLHINEFMASNVISTPEIVDFDDYSDWIEIYNSSTGSIDLGGYYLTDDLDNLTKWQIPNNTVIGAKKHLIFWADGNDNGPENGYKYFHLNFKLSKSGEEIGLSSPDGELLDSIIYNSQLSDVSFGRKPDGSSNWFYFGEPTPSSANITNGVTNQVFSTIPEISLTSGFYEGAQQVTVNSNSTEDLITYTTDGSIPKSTSNQYIGPISITKNTTLRTRVFESGKLPSKTVTRSYFIDQVQNLPILSLTVLPETFFDDEIGIYRNQIKSREVPVNVQYFERGGEFAFEVDAGIRLSGQASFTYPQKPLTIETDDRYGDEKIDYPVFHNRPFESYTSIYLRNSGTDDNQHTMFRDALQHTIIINQMDVDCQAYQPALTFINGEYWGIYNIREKLDNSYFVAHHQANPDNIDHLEYEFNPEPVIVEGNRDDYYALQNFLAGNSMNIEENWEYVKSQIDVYEVMNYLIAEIYCDNVNWPNTNSRWWKEKSEIGKWRYIFLDSDFGFGNPGWFSTYNHNMFIYLTQQQPPFSTFVFGKLMENEGYQADFIQRFATYLGGIFEVDRVVGIVDSLKEQIRVEMIDHIDRWNGFPGQIPNVAAWNTEVAIMREFAQRRPAIMKQHINDFFNLSGTSNVQFNVSEIEGGYIELGDIRVEDGFSADYFRYIPLRVKAVPNIGYRFVKWIGVNDSFTDSTVYHPLRADSTIQITAVFEEDDVSILPATISENMTLDAASSPYFAKGSITVNSGVSLTVEPGVEILMPGKSNLWINGILQINGSKEDPVTIKANEISGYSNWGIIYLDSTSGPNHINNLNLIGAISIESDSSKIGAISSYKSDVTIENTTILDAPFPIFIQYGNVVIRGCKLHSEVTCDLINVKYAESALTENCEFRGNNAFDTDAIDYDQISNGIIRNNRIYNFYGFNSDGIDLGEGSKEILIENNLIINCNDKGVSVGQASTTTIKNNIIISCAQGVGIKDDSSYALADRNTFFDCGYGVASFEKNLGAGGGNAKVINSIISKSNISPFLVDDLSVLDISYSLSDTEELNGTNNLLGDPKFSNNFFLTSASPARNSGNPDSGTDPDGSLIDLGARYFTENIEPLLINEIHYNPNNGDGYEFIEFYNSGNEAIDLTGYSINGAVNFNFSDNMIIDPKSFIIAAKEPSNYENLETPVLSWGSQSLPNLRGDIILLDNSGNEIDFVSYSNRFGWPSAANGEGNSLELRNPNEENAVTKHWKPSDSFGGSPGRENRIVLSDLIYINEFQANNRSTIKDENGDFDDWIEIYNDGNERLNLGGIFITDDFNNLTKHQFVIANNESDYIEPKEHRILWADASTSQGINHLNFRLNNDGEEIALVYIFDNDTTIIDSISFGNQEVDFSYARESDGVDKWKVVKAPTPGEKNSITGLFGNGILLVNGYRLTNDAAINFYDNRTLWGNNKIKFWDLFESPSIGYPVALPDPIGHGPIPLDTLTNYSTIIWTGENIATEQNNWLNSPVLKYVKMGGNIVALFRNGKTYLDNSEFMERLGISWVEEDNTTILNCTPIYEGLDTISIETGQFLSSAFDTTLTNDKSNIIYIDPFVRNGPVGVGVWNKPTYGGWYKENGGQIIFLSGRGYRYNNNDLKKNILYMFKNFFEEPDIVTDTFDSNDLLITDYKLNNNYPNPFNPTTVIKYDLLKSARVELRIYNILGQEVKTLVNKYQDRGHKTAIWNGRDNNDKQVSSGIYFYRITSDKWTDIKKMMLLK